MIYTVLPQWESAVQTLADCLKRRNAWTILTYFHITQPGRYRLHVRTDRGGNSLPIEAEAAVHKERQRYCT
jgi:hypothetical protein